MSVISHDDRLPWVVSLLLLPLLHRHLRMRVTMDGSGSKDADEDDGASSPSDDKIST